MAQQQGDLHYVCLDASFRACELIINAYVARNPVTVAGVQWGLALNHNLHTVFLSICGVEPGILPTPSRHCYLIESNYSIIIRSKNATEEHPYTDAFMWPNMHSGIIEIQDLSFPVCEFARLEDYLDARGRIHVECWLAFRNVFFAPAGFLLGESSQQRLG